MVAPTVPASPPAKKFFENVAGLADFLVSDISLSKWQTCLFVS